MVFGSLPPQKAEGIRPYAWCREASYLNDMSLPSDQLAAAVTSGTASAALIRLFPVRLVCSRLGRLRGARILARGALITGRLCGAGVLGRLRRGAKL